MGRFSEKTAENIDEKNNSDRSSIKLEKPKVAPLSELGKKGDDMKSSASEVSIESTAINKLGEWIKSDSLFLNYLERVRIVGSQRINIKFDLETEGYLEEIDIEILYSAMKDSDYVIQFVGRAFMEVPYVKTVLMGKIKTGVVSAPYSSPNLDERDMIEVLNTISDEERTTDTLSLMLFQNEDLKRLISKSLKTASPDPEHIKNIGVPIVIKPRKDEGCDIILKSFFDENIRPIDLFVRIMDTIAGTLDQLLDVEAKAPEESSKAVDDNWQSLPKPKAKTQFSSKFINRKDASIDNIPTCPHCDRPLPRAQSTAYRRCPFCYEKLD